MDIMKATCSTTDPTYISMFNIFKRPSKQPITDKLPQLYRDCLQQSHLLIAGSTGSGKSVIINYLIYTAMFNAPSDIDGGVHLILIDPKRVELADYKHCKHTLYYASEPEQMYHAIQYAMQLCESRYKRMQKSGLRKYNGSDVYLIIDEFADLMTTDRRRIQPLIQRLAQIGRAARIHIILATQTPIAKVLPTEIKCNFDSRIGLRTRSAQDSRNILGCSGLEQLPKYGHCYYMTPNYYGKCTVPMVPEEKRLAMIDYRS